MPEDPAYDLLVLLDPEAPEERRAELVEQIKRQIDSGGAELKGDVDWGMRKLSFEIDHRREAEYHLFQFEAKPQVLTQLDRSLSIDDSVLRHRIIRLPGETPAVPPKPAEDSAARRQSDERGRGEEAPPATAAETGEPDSEAPPAPVADEPPSAPAPETGQPEAVPAEGPAAEGAPGESLDEPEEQS
jgi:small subunit ribosomal protein S6